MAMRDRATATMPAEELPKDVRARLRARPIPGQPFTVTAEPAEETDAEKLAALQAHVARGLADADAGRVFSHDEVFGELKARYPEV
jgi:hypothetical protein